MNYSYLYNKYCKIVLVFENIVFKNTWNQKIIILMNGKNRVLMHV